MGFAAAAVEALFEQADFGFQFGGVLLVFAVPLREAGVARGVAVGQLFLEFRFALDSALVQSLVQADLLACVAEELLAGRQTAGGLAGQRVTQNKVIRFHNGSMPGQPSKG
jgi:hypothetical protein